MSVQFKFFSLPILCEEDMEEELNTFLRSIRIIAVPREMVRQDGGRTVHGHRHQGKAGFVVERQSQDSAPFL